MARANYILGAAVCGILLSTGCCLRRAPTGGESPPPLSPEQVPLVERGLFVPAGGFSPFPAGHVPGKPVEHDAACGSASCAGAHLPEAAPPPYRALTARDVQCLAAKASGPGNLLDGELQQVEEKAPSHPHLRRKSDREAQMQETILQNKAVEARNLSAAAALALYYRLIEAEAKADLVARSQDVLREAVQQTEALRAKGFKTPIDLPVLQRQVLDAQIQGQQARLAIDQLNGQLQQLLGFDVRAGEWLIRPATELRVVPCALDMHAEIERGLSQRAELVMLRSLLEQLDATTLPEVRKLMQAQTGLVSLAAPGIGLKVVVRLQRVLPGKKRRAEGELEARRQQLKAQLDDKERSVILDVRQAVHALETRAQLVELAFQKDAHWRERLREAEDKAARGLTSFAEISAARLDWLKGQADLVQEAVAWHNAGVQLKQAQGLLAIECGYHPTGDGAAECGQPHGAAGPPAACGACAGPEGPGTACSVSIDP
jgi:hypothetical protein